MSYTIAANGKSITCGNCGKTSYGPGDVKHRFCPQCGFHEGPRDMSTIEMKVEMPWDEEVPGNRTYRDMALFCNSVINGPGSEVFPHFHSAPRRHQGEVEPYKYQLGSANDFFLHHQGGHVYRLSARYSTREELTLVFKVLEWRYGADVISLVGESALERLSRRAE